MGNNIDTIQSIGLENFKGYRASEDGGPKELDFTIAGQPADLILVTGKNGVGKTSLLEAMDWVLNQSNVGAGGFITTKESKGAVSINGKRFELNGKAKTDHKKLSTVASFFYQENIAGLACDEIIQLLEPENKPGEEIKRSLKALQAKLEDWQRQLHTLKYRKNYDEERKTLAGRVNELVDKLPHDLPFRQLLVDSTLTLKNGNLQNKWDSQIRNLSSSIGNFSNLAEPIGSQLPDQLSHIGHSLLEYRGRQVDFSEKGNEPPAFTKEFLSTIQSLPANLFIKKWSEDTILAPSELENTLFVGSDTDIYADTVDELEKQRIELTYEYQRLNKLQAQLQGDGSSLLTWIDGFTDNVSSWLEAWDEHPDISDVIDLKQGLQVQLEKLSILTTARSVEIRGKIEKVTLRGQAVTASLNQIKRSQVVVRDINAHSNQLSQLLNEPNLTVEGLTDYVSNYLETIKTPVAEGASVVSETDIIHQLGRVFTNWSALEIQKVEDEANAIDWDGLEHAEKMITDALAISKQESSARSQLLSAVEVIPQAELDQLLKNMNQLLASFHFPDDFLPIELKNDGTPKIPKWGFKTKSDVPFDDLSTGQKSQLAICWTINLNLALSEQLGHRVIGFDDFTTSLDMNQLIPAAVLLRKLAYADANDSWKRQVIVTSHHEDLTNRMLDFLLPPQGKSMKVIQFEDWLPRSGPEFKCYNVDMGKVKEDGLQDAVKRVVQTT
ncbi:AAA family ATPase [Vibrio metoecus]|uniref:Recombinase RecF n=2 Tax=Vibrio metoecus TaxID=1481663 RepID=A0A271VSP5_VIBMT|nr:AAA family ATPase [Vibrio metoecus]KQB09798.1 recombinase RecF [Vibrio metoecus]PAR20829.1 recombinase RecF [Vibrio metoecus]PAR23580.1 recombinase RecF [Vibrio metoecus]